MPSDIKELHSFRDFHGCVKSHALSTIYVICVLVCVSGVMYAIVFILYNHTITTHAMSNIGSQPIDLGPILSDSDINLRKGSEACS